MPSSSTRTPLDGRIVMLGFGSIGQAVLPLLLRHLDLRLEHRLGSGLCCVSCSATWAARRARDPDGFVAEGLQPAELGWGSHERHFPPDGARHDSGCRAAIYLRRPGAGTRVRSWTPLGGPYQGFLITHAESISIADHLTVGDPGQPAYRPTVQYASHACDDALLSVQLAGRQWRQQDEHRLLRDDILEGRDELGVLASPLVAGMRWAIEHPECGVLEPDDRQFLNFRVV